MDMCSHAAQIACNTAAKRCIVRAIRMCTVQSTPKRAKGFWFAMRTMSPSSTGITQSRTRHKETAGVGRSCKLRADLVEAACRVGRPRSSTHQTASIRRGFGRRRQPQDLSIQLEVLRCHDVPRYRLRSPQQAFAEFGCEIGLAQDP